MLRNTGIDFYANFCYTTAMYNWSTNTDALQKQPEKFIIWKLEQMINFGLRGERLNMAILKKYWDKLELDPARKKYIAFLLYGRDSLKNTNQTS